MTTPKFLTNDKKKGYYPNKMTKGFQSPVNLAYRLESLTKSLARLESHPQAESENEARRLVSLLRASSEFRGMDSLLQSARNTEQASSATFPIRLKELITEIQQAIEHTPNQAGMILILSSDVTYTSLLSGSIAAAHHQAVVALSSPQANELIASAPISFCIVDLVLADIDGRAFIAELRTRPETAAIPVIAIVPSPAESPVIQPFSVPGADSIFAKSSDIEDITNYLTLRLKRSHMKGLQARRDPVTGLPNRAACHEIFRQLQHSIQVDDPLAFALVGIPQFTSIASQCTPLSCDELMRKIGAILSSSLRATDVVARWDVSEFAILLTGEDHFGATKALEKILPALSELSIQRSTGETLPITICIGLTINHSHTTIEDAALRAESHLYMAFSDPDSHSGGKQIVSDAIPIIHREEPVALCLTNAGMAKVIKHILEHETFRVEIFPDTESVLRRISDTPFSMLILDDELPQESGFHLLQRLNEHANTGTLGTMMMISREESIERVMKLGANDYFLKPPTMPAFLSQIRRIISHHTLQQPNTGVTIMVADHELPQLLLAGTTLHQLGTCQILLAKGAVDALQRLRNSHPEYLILDHEMPHISLTEFITQMQNMDWLKNTKIILSKPDPSEPPPFAQRHLILGSITRPYNPAVLLAEMQKLIPALPKTAKGRIPTDPRLLELEVQRILSLKA